MKIREYFNDMHLRGNKKGGNKLSKVQKARGRRLRMLRKTYDRTTFDEFDIHGNTSMEVKLAKGSVK